MTTDRESDPSMRQRRQRRPLGWVALAVAVLVFLGASAVRQIALGGEAARRSIARDLAELTGLPVVFGGGKPAFRLFPVPRLSLEEVVIGERLDGPRLTVASMTADLDLWAALLGRTEIDRLVLVSPQLSAPPGIAPDASMPAAFGPFLSRLHGLGDVEIRDGLLTRDRKGEIAIVSAANISLSWPGEGSAASLSGTYAWNGQPVRLGLRLGAPLSWLKGRSSAVDLDLASPQLDLAFDGEASAAGRLSGRVTANLPSLARALRWLAEPRIPVPEIGPLSLAADLTSDGGRLDIANAEVSIDGFAGRGALDLAFPETGPPSLGGTLAFGRLDLDSIANALAPAPRSPIEAARPIPVGFVARLDIDLRISAREGQIGALALNDLAGTVKMKDGIATLDIGDAGLLGGNGQMRASVDTRSAPAILKGSASMRGVDATGLLAAFGISPAALSGTADLSASIEAPITSWAEIFARHRLEATLSARAGALSGIDAERLRIPGASTFDAAPSSAANLSFSTLKAEIASEGPQIALTSLRILGEAGTVTGAGLLINARNETDIAGLFQPAADGGEEAALTKPKPIALRMRGSWPRPVVVTSADSADE